MSIWISILLIALISVLVIDVSGFIENAEGILGKFLGYNVHIPKPFSCSLCTSFWASLIFSIATHNFSLPVIAYSLFISFLTPVISDAVWVIRDFLGFVIAWINTWWKI